MTNGMFHNFKLKNTQKFIKSMDGKMKMFYAMIQKLIKIMCK